MHLLFVHNDYGRYSGEEEATEGIAALLIEHGHRVTWMRKSSAGIEDSLALKVKAFGAGIWSPASRREMRELLQRDRPDVVQVQNLYPFVSSSVLGVCRQHSIPVVMRCPNYRLFCPSGLHLRAGAVCENCLGLGREWNCVRYRCEGSFSKSVGYAARNAFNRLTGTITENVDRFVVLSEFQRARFEAGGIPPAALRVVPNVAPTDRVAATGVPPAGPVTFVGRVDPAKGVGEFIEAARRLPDIPFSLVGHVERELVTRLRIPENVRIRGFLRGAELDEAFREAGLVVCPSKWFEGFPNVIARALSHGRPVVGSRIGVIPELIADGLNGMVCEPQDAASLTAAIGRLWRDPRRRSELGATARSIAESRYSPSAVYTLWRKVYEELAAKT